MILYSTFMITIGIAIIFHYLLSIRKKRQLESIKSDWTHFNRGVQNKLPEGIIKYGTNLVFNEHLTASQLEKMYSDIKNLVEEFPELEELRVLLYNKHLTRSMNLPYY